jgi:polysaccharide export outer membrane protein
VTRPKIQSKLAAVVVLIVGAAIVCPAEQGDQTPPKELVEYVRQAKQQGESDEEIRKKAAAIGWPEAVVRQAIAYGKSGKPAPASPMTPKETSASPQPAPSASFEMPQTDPVASAGTDERSAAAQAGPRVAARSGSDDYLIGAGDTLQVAVFKDPDLSVPNQMVRPDGRITLPLVKEVAVAGMTERQAEAAIAAAMGKFVTDPVVTVVVTLPTSKKIYMVGAVRKEGTLPYTYGMTVMQAISEGGGLNDYAKKTKIYVLRTENGREYRLEFNYKEVLKGERMEQNIMLLPGDTVVIPQ